MMQRAPSRTLLSAVALCLAGAGPLRAQEATKIPESPALTYLGASPAEIARPTTARDLGIAISDAVDSAGLVRQGFALDFQPWVVLRAPVTRQQYRRSWLWYTLANLSLSAGSARSAAGDTASTSLAIGARTTFVNRADPLASDSLARELHDEVQRQCPRERFRDPATGLVDEDRRLRTCLVPLTDSLSDVALYEWGHWNGYALSGAVVVGGRLPESRIDGLRYDGVSTWLMAALPISRSGQLIAQGRFDSRWISDDTTANVVSTGTRLLWGGRTTNAFAELIGRWSDTGEDRSSAKWSAGLEVQTSRDLWLAVGFGSTFATRVEDDRVRIIANLRWGLSPGPRLEPGDLRARP